MIWELCKIRIKEYTTTYCSYVNESRKSKITVLEDKLKRNVSIDDNERQAIKKNLVVYIYHLLKVHRCDQEHIMLKKVKKVLNTF